MSLNWDCAKIRDKQEVLEGTEWMKTNAIIFSTMAIDMGVIGGPVEVRRMIADLQAALAVMEGGE